ncbi:MAG: hypothetical protein Q8S33_26890 [Myxococcales bacterium]|nr:hypothetical protein [Myxococcales bacterium]MDP3503994.1 hypothetical protein [Myxococcales bacterium]
MSRLALLASLVLVAACGRVALLDEPDAGGGSGGGRAGGSAAGGTAGNAGGGSTAGGTAGGGSTAGGVAGGGVSGGGVAGGGSAGGAAGGAGGGEPFNPCRGLSAGDCRANALCDADFCFACSCRPNFEGCRLKVQTPAVCPAFGCPQPQCCSDDSTCGRPLVCMAADRVSCGACNNAPSTCATDASCNTSVTGNVCLPRACACSGQTDCQPGCSAQNPCRDGETCDAATKRCEQTRCTSTPCPSGFNCVLGPTGNVCIARSCTSDRDCGDIFCVSGTCRTSLGVCNQFMP